MKPFLEHAQEYAQYHKKPSTLYTHFVGVPLIVFSLMLFFSFLHFVVPGVFSITSAELITVLVLIYYIVLDWRLGLSVTPIFVLLLWLADWIGAGGPTEFTVTIFLVCFIVGWAIQLIGHFLEGRRPAFITNLWQALIAPLFLTAEAYFLCGRMNSLKDRIYEDVKSKK